jgi:hypothetical protein
MLEVDDSIEPAQFRRWLREGASKDGLASKLVMHVFGKGVTEATLGLGRTVALHYCSPSVYQIRQCIRYIFS